MPKMQEHFSAAMDGGNAENAGAFFGRHGWRTCRECTSNSRPVPDGGQAETKEFLP
jgi:hypothetical protein